ncbi:hypothetical protein Dsin_019610 [Dipteronia sinensis]|uniref:RRM domain-containing protein n=1 Tax=Dipteronia sinensis TaxID=43782 RepID=A0AAE0A8E2_9ROSI|nr:hypothetical protein Dsin_019610 [Dipteronia sinensis]
MRERVRERSSSGSFRHRDFRSNLVSVFVDNLNPIVELKDLWGVFKSFGRIRDLFLSPKNRTRRSCFAFVRFGSKEEALRFVDLTNGMHVFSWPILTKVASLEWKVRNKAWITYAEAVGISVNNHYVKDSKVDLRKVPVVKESVRSEVVKWNEEIVDSRWISLCAVGVFKKISDVCAMINRCSERNIQLSSYYIEDKNILWQFKSVELRNDFIRRKDLWVDFFSFVGGWSNDITPQCRLSWIEFRGIPLNVWCEEFFLKLGWAVGEVLLVEEETVNREILCRGKTLTLIPNGRSCPQIVKVVVGRNSFSVSAREDPIPIDMGWISGKFGFGSGDSTVPMGVGFEANVKKRASGPKARGEATINKTTFQFPLAKAPVSRKVVQFDLGLGSGNDMGLGSGMSKSGFLVKPRLACGIPRKAHTNEKGIIIDAAVPINSATLNGLQNEAVDKGKNVEMTRWCEDSGDSLNVYSRDGSRNLYPFLGGEPSMAGINQVSDSNIVIDLRGGGCGGNDKNVGPSFKEALLNGGQRNVLETGNMEAQVTNVVDEEEDMSNEVSFSSVENSLSHVSETLNLGGDILSENQTLGGDNIVVCSDGKVRDRTRKFSSIRKVIKPCSSVKCHGMKTRKDRRSIAAGFDDIRGGISGPNSVRGRWNLEVELTKAVEKGVAMGYFKVPSSINDRGAGIAGSRESADGGWSFSNEVAKVIEMGVALGLDFKGKEDEVVAEIDRREKEDEARGLGRMEKRRVVRDLVRSTKPSILFIQESKLNHFDSRIIKSLGGSILSKGMGVEANGSAGGVITLWNEDVFGVKSCIHNDRCIILAGMLFSINTEVVFCNVYAANNEIERLELWKFILAAKLSLPGPWIIGGDFNTVFDQRERKGGIGSVRSMRNFQLFADAANVIDLPLQVQKGLGRSLSDHNPVILGELMVDWGPKPFRFLNVWLEDKKFMECVRKKWVSCSRGVSAGLILKHKIGAVRCFMKAHANNCKSDGKVIKDLEEDLARIESNAVAYGWSAGLREQRSSCLVKLWKQVRLDEQKWRQVSRVKWLKEDDRNLKFFHIMSNVRRKANFLGDLFISGSFCKGPAQVREVVLSFFSGHFKKKVSCRPNWGGLQVSLISMEERLKLEVEFSEDEVWKAVSDCDGNKAPGPDGLNLNFIKSNWEVIKGDFMNFLHTFYNDGSVIKDFNCTFIALIPKVKASASLQDYRPISLVGSLYKVLAKVLANRLKNVMDSVIGPAQMAFVKDRQIVDSFVIAEEVIHTWRKSGRGGLLVKLDFEKA